MNQFSIQHITKRFDGVLAVNDVSIVFPKGQIVGVIGSNGSGKSTLINAVTGMIPFDKGMVIVGDSKMTKIIPYAITSRGMTRTFQEVRLFNQMNVWDNILVVLTKRTVIGAFFSKETDNDKKMAHEVLQKVGLWDKKNSLASQLSYGQRKLLEVARVMCGKSEIIFFDEPFAGLFPQMITMVVDLMKEMSAMGKTIILVEHNMELIRALCQKLVVMDGGAILAQGEPAKILKEKQIIEAYLGD